MIKRSILLAAVSALAFGPARAGAGAGLKATVPNLDDVPEALHGFYVQSGDVYVLQVEGMKPEAEFTRVQGALTKERGEHSALKAKITTHFGTRPFEEIVADIDRIPELEASQGTIDETKINSIVEGRVRTALAPVERERDALKVQVGEKDQTINGFETKERQRTIRDKAREAAVAAKLLPEAVDDFLLLADSVLEVRDDDGKVVVKDQVGFTPGVEPGVLLTDLQTKRPHWWGPSEGGGAGGQRQGGAAGTNPFTYAGWNMTAQGQLMQADPQKAEQLAKAAGHRDAATARKPAAPAA